MPDSKLAAAESVTLPAETARSPASTTPCTVSARHILGTNFDIFGDIITADILTYPNIQVWFNHISTIYVPYINHILTWLELPNSWMLYNLYIYWISSHLQKGRMLYLYVFIIGGAAYD